MDQIGLFARTQDGESPLGGVETDVDVSVCVCVCVCVCAHARVYAKVAAATKTFCVPLQQHISSPPSEESGHSQSVTQVTSEDRSPQSQLVPNSKFNVSHCGVCVCVCVCVCLGG